MKFLMHFVLKWYRQMIRHPKARWWIVLATVGYLILPTDLAPDFLPIIGQIDDAAIASLLVAEIAPMVIEKLKNRKKPQTTEASVSA